MKENLKISIVVPCFNMENYIEETLQSIINQEYSNLELIVVDGGSTDNTLKIIENYRDNIDILISEKDKGQYNAINKGFGLASGDIYAWINADDKYYSWTFKHVAAFFKKYKSVDWISGATSVMSENGLINSFPSNAIPKPRKFIANGWFREDYYGVLQQEGMFWTKELWLKNGGLNESYSLASDFELWTRFAKHSDLVSFGIPLACFRDRKSARSRLHRDKYNKEVDNVCKNLNKLSFILRILFGINFYFKIFLRKFTFSRSNIYYYSPMRKEWIMRSVFAPMSSHSFSKILFMR